MMTNSENEMPFWRSPRIVGVFAGAVVLLCLWSVFRVIADQRRSANPVEAHWSKIEQLARQKGIDPRTDPVLAPAYFRAHPNEKQPFVPVTPTAAAANAAIPPKK